MVVIKSTEMRRLSARVAFVQLFLLAAAGVAAPPAFALDLNIQDRIEMYTPKADSSIPPARSGDTATVQGSKKEKPRRRKARTR